MICFPIRATYDEEGAEIKRDDHHTRFKAARDGDHLMVPFQCELCHFRNVQDRDPDAGSPEDVKMMVYMRRVNLDLFWSRDTLSIQANLRGVKRAVKTMEKFKMRYDALFPAMGPHPLKDTFGMAAAVAMLDRSLDPGRHEEHVQFETFRKLRSAVTNLHQASVDGLKDRVGAYEKNKTWFSSSPTMGFGFTRFMEGIHRRVGDLVKRDEPINIELLKAVLEHLESE